MEFHSQQEVCPSGMGWLWWGLEGAGSKINAAVPASQSGGVVGGGGGPTRFLKHTNFFSPKASALEVPVPEILTPLVPALYSGLCSTITSSEGPSLTIPGLSTLW